MRSMKITMNTRLNICSEQADEPVDRMLATGVDVVVDDTHENFSVDGCRNREGKLLRCSYRSRRRSCDDVLADDVDAPGWTMVNRMLTAIHASMSAAGQHHGDVPRAARPRPARGPRTAARTGPPPWLAPAARTRAQEQASLPADVQSSAGSFQLKVFPAFRPRRRCSVCHGQRTPLPGRLPRARRAFPFARPAAGRCRGNSPQAASCSCAALRMRPSRVNTSICPRLRTAEMRCATMILYRIGKP